MGCIDQNARMWRIFSHKDIKNVIQDLEVDLSSGPDSFPINFFVVGQDFIRNKPMKVFENPMTTMLLVYR